jgi:hypothetical protein
VGYQCIPIRTIREYKEHIGIFLTLVTDPGASNIRASMYFKMDDPRNSIVESPEGTYVYRQELHCYGYRQFITTVAATSRYMGRDSSLTVHCRLEVYSDRVAVTAGRDAIVIGVPPSNMS